MSGGPAAHPRAEAIDPSPWRARAPLAVALLALLILGADCVYRAGPTERTDLPVYLAGARRVLAGEDPFGATSTRGWPYVYPPTFATLLIPLTPLRQRVAAGLWFALSAAALALGALGVRRSLGRDGPFAWRVDGLALALIAVPTASALLRGQVGPLLLGLAGGALWALRARRDVLAGALLALATAIKLTPGLLLVGLVVARRWRAAAAAAGALAVWLVLVPLPLLGLGGTTDALTHFGQRMVLRPLRDPGASDLTAQGVHIGTNQSLTSQLVRRAPPGALRTAGLVVLACAICGAALIAAGRGGPDDGLGPGPVGLLLAAPLLVAPIAWHHHHVVLLPLIGWLVLRRPNGSRVALAAFAVLSLLHFAVKPLRPFGLLGLGTLGLFVAGVAHGPARKPEGPIPTSREAAGL